MIPPTEKKDEPSTEAKKDEPKKDEPKAEGAPEKYEAFKVPEGRELSPEITAAAQEVFKKHNLSQEAAQEFVDLWNAQTSNLSERLDALVAETRNGWRNEIAKDKTLGNGVDNLNDASKKAISDAIAATGDAAAQSALKEALDLTGAGDHPKIVAAFVALGKLVGEATLVRGGGPAEVKQPGKVVSAATALYPNLPSSAKG